MKTVHTRERPFVSVIIPCRNEESFIGACLSSILATSYPQGRLEILVVDGLSRDGTRRVVEQYAEQHACVRLVDNPKGVTASALNIGVSESKGRIVCIMGAHATCQPDYLPLCVQYLLEYGADNVGGVLKTVPRDSTPFGRAIAIALAHPFGVGNAQFRVGAKTPVFVDTVFGGCYRREVFDRIGPFNEELRFSQDLEFNRRLLKAGGKILLVPKIVCEYHARSDLRSFVRHNFRNGLWAILPFAHSTVVPVSWRQLVPGAFVGALLGSALLGSMLPLFRCAFSVVAVGYLAAALGVSVAAAVKQRDLRHAIYLPTSFAALHLAYGLGSLWGLIRLPAAIRARRRAYEAEGGAQP